MNAIRNRHCTSQIYALIQYINTNKKHGISNTIHGISNTIKGKLHITNILRMYAYIKKPTTMFSVHMTGLYITTVYNHGTCLVKLHILTQGI
jgi:hypothetical protein